jgi:hypothetical protein
VRSSSADLARWVRQIPEAASSAVVVAVLTEHNRQQ